MIVKLFADDGAPLFVGCMDLTDEAQFIRLVRSPGAPARLCVDVTDLSAVTAFAQQPRHCMTLGHDDCLASTTGTLYDQDDEYTDVAYCAECTAELVEAHVFSPSQLEGERPEPWCTYCGGPHEIKDCADYSTDRDRGEPGTEDEAVAVPLPETLPYDRALPDGERITDGNGDELERGADSERIKPCSRCGGSGVEVDKCCGHVTVPEMGGECPADCCNHSAMEPPPDTSWITMEKVGP